jgi:hypothetical protein
MSLNDAEQAAIGRDLLVCQRLAAALSRRLRVLHKRVSADRSEAALTLTRHERDVRAQADEIGAALEWRLDDLIEVAEWIRDNTGGWDEDAEDAAALDAIRAEIAAI